MKVYKAGPLQAGLLFYVLMMLPLHLGRNFFNENFCEKYLQNACKSNR
jgi:hypothetical protein